MKWQLLGPVQLTEPPVQLPVTPKANTVLSLLLCRCGTVVPVSALVDECWGAEPPRSARTTLQTYILRLRRALATALATTPETVAREILVTYTGGYRLVIDAGELDISNFAALARDGAACHNAGNAWQATELFDRALGLWKGPPFADVPCGPALQAEAVRLTELQMAINERRIAIQLDFGRSHEALGEIAALTSLHPMNENLHGLLMLALHQAGRRSEALDVFRRLRVLLVEELGVEPQANLRNLYQEMLSDSPDIGTSTVTTRFLAA